MVFHAHDNTIYEIFILFTCIIAIFMTLYKIENRGMSDLLGEKW